jgi:hypothetical protein
VPTRATAGTGGSYLLLRLAQAVEGVLKLNRTLVQELEHRLGFGRLGGRLEHRDRELE